MRNNQILFSICFCFCIHHDMLCGQLDVWEVVLWKCRAGVDAMDVPDVFDVTNIVNVRMSWTWDHVYMCHCVGMYGCHGCVDVVNILLSMQMFWILQMSY